MLRKIMVIIICVLFFGITCNVLGASTINNQKQVKNLAPIEVIDQQQTTDCGAGCPFFNYLWLAQGFTPKLDTITKVELKLFKGGNPTSDIVVSIRSALTGSDLTSVTLDGGQVSVYAKWFELDFIDIDIVPNQMYYIVCRTPGGSAINYYCCSFQINNPYSGGEVWGSLNSGGTWEIIEYPGYPDPDGCFITYGLDESPNKPIIDGSASGNAGTEYTYTISATDPENHDVYYNVDWGDSTSTGWKGPYYSGEEITFKHTWHNQGEYTIAAKAKDIYDAEGPEATLKVTMPRNKIINNPFFEFLQNHPNLFPILRQLLRL